MDNLFKKQFSAGMMEIIKDKELYYVSTVDSKYNKLTEKGQQAVLEYVIMMAPHILEKEEEMLVHKAKQLVFEELKK
jgi:archaeosine-15-forming tRNA-guanine transglycosylase